LALSLTVGCGSSSTADGPGSGGASATGGQTSIGGAAGSGAAGNGGSSAGGSNGAGGLGALGGTGSGSGSATGSGGSDASGGDSPGAGGESGGASTGGTDGGVGGSAPSFLFSADFENETEGRIPSTGNASWTTTLPTNYDSGGVVDVQTGSGAHGGSKFVYVKKGGDNQAFLQLKDPRVFPFSASKIHVRAFIKVATWPSSHASWMEVGTVKNEEAEMRFGAHEGVLQVNHWPGDQDQIAAGVKFDVDTWTCIEYSYEPGTKTLKVWLNEQPVDALTVVGSFARGGAFDPAPPIDAIRFGAEINGTDAYYDDVVVHTDFIGCD
jgi:hypothetical protein